MINYKKQYISKNFIEYNTEKYYIYHIISSKILREKTSIFRIKVINDILRLNCLSIIIRYK